MIGHNRCPDCIYKRIRWNLTLVVVVFKLEVVGSSLH